MVPDVIRRVITGQRENGDSVFTHVEEIEPLRRQDGTAQWWGVWEFDQLPTLPYFNDHPFSASSMFPRPGGVRVQVVNIPPGPRDSQAPPSDEMLRLQTAVDVDIDYRDERTGMHMTDTIDIGIVVSGECEIRQADGERVRLRVGDVYVQNGAEHAWRNDTSQPFIIVFVFLGAVRRRGVPKRLDA